MNRIMILTTMALLTLSPSGLFADDNKDEGPTACTNETLKGSYGVSIIGVTPAASVLEKFPLSPVGTLEQFIGVVVHIFDGKGKFTQTDHVKGYLSGAVLDRPGAGTYSVKPDCSGTYSIFIPGLSFPVVVVRFVIVDGGKEFRGFVVTPQEAMTTANGRRMN